MSNIRGYEQTFEKTNIGLGIGGNPTDMTLQTNDLNDAKDKIVYTKDDLGVTISPPETPQPKQLTQQDLLAIMTNKE